MKRQFKAALILFIAIIVLSSCNGNTTQSTQKVPVSERVPEEITDAGHLSGTIHVLAPRPPEIMPSGYKYGFIQFYEKYFTDLHPDVEIEYEYYAEDWSYNVSTLTEQPTLEQVTALNTRLLADPPDMLIFDPSTTIFEKSNMSVLYTDLYDFIYGPRGLDRADYFDNIFTAMEQQGSLYHISPYVTFEMILLNRRLFDMVGVDADAIKAISMGELLDIYQRVEEIYDDSSEPLSFSPTFSFPQVLLNERLYNVETEKVNVNTPQMKERLEIAVNIPIGFRAGFTPEAWILGVWGTSLGRNEAILNPTGMLVHPMVNNLTYLRIPYLQDHPDMQFTNPVHLTNDNGDIAFTAFHESFSILRRSANQELAWEFVRYIMEFEDSMQWATPSGNSAYEGYSGHNEIPVNRQKFESRLNELAYDYYDALEHFEGISRFIDDYDARKAEQMPIAVGIFRDAMESLNYERRRSWGVTQSLLYPDCWLLYSDQQSIERTLANIQNRLEIYVAE